LLEKLEVFQNPEETFSADRNIVTNVPVEANIVKCDAKQIIAFDHKLNRVIMTAKPHLQRRFTDKAFYRKMCETNLEQVNNIKTYTTGYFEKTSRNYS